MPNKAKQAGIAIPRIKSNLMALYSSELRNFSWEHAPHSKQASIAVRSFVPGLNVPGFNVPGSPEQKATMTEYLQILF